MEANVLREELSTEVLKKHIHKVIKGLHRMEVVVEYLMVIRKMVIHLIPWYVLLSYATTYKLSSISVVNSIRYRGV